MPVSPAPTAPSFDALFAGLRPVGRDARTGGYRRLPWTAVDAELRAWFAAQATARGLALETDRNGNQWAWWGDPDAGPPGVVTGSHLDSVVDGGAFDGALGVVAAFAALDALRRQGLQPRRPLAVVNMADEEGARFGVACVGSRLLTGALDPDRARALRDPDGVTLAEAMARAGHDPATLGADPEACRRIGVFVELHVEQGRALADTGDPVAVAERIHPHGRWRLDFAGRADHAGTTRLADRDDPTLKLARAVLAARAAAESTGGLATVGRIQLEPNVTNAVPAAARAWLDARGPTEEAVRAVVARAGETASAVSEESWTPPVVFPADLRERVRALSGGPALPTGAGHDAGVLAAAGVPAAMLFVRNPTGVSHSPAEHADPADCHAGVAALTSVLADLLTTP